MTKKLTNKNNSYIVNEPFFQEFLMNTSYNRLKAICDAERDRLLFIDESLSIDDLKEKQLWLMSFLSLTTPNTKLMR